MWLYQGIAWLPEDDLKGSKHVREILSVLMLKKCYIYALVGVLIKLWEWSKMIEAC